MTKTTHLSWVMAAMLYLTLGVAIAADNAEAQHASPTAIKAPENQPNSREETTHANSSQSNAAKVKENPAKTQEEPDCSN